MPRVCAMLSRVNTYSHTRPSRCPRCNGGILHRHGEVGILSVQRYLDFRQS